MTILMHIYFIGVIVFGSQAISGGLAEILTPVDRNSHVGLSKKRRFIFWIMIIYGLTQWYFLKK